MLYLMKYCMVIMFSLRLHEAYETQNVKESKENVLRDIR